MKRRRNRLATEDYEKLVEMGIDKHLSKFTTKECFCKKCQKRGGK
jgi:hypothetical protein